MEQTNEIKYTRTNLYGDGIGYVELISYMGDEFTPAEDARMSTGKGRLGPEKDAALQKRLLKDKHTSPFEGVVVKMELCVPLFVLRELDRHRTVTKLSDEEKGWAPSYIEAIEAVSPEEQGRKWFSRNEMSGRYVQMPNQYYFPQKIRYQDSKNAQAGLDTPNGAFEKALTNAFIDKGQDVVRQARELYDWAVAQGVEKGLARIFNTQNQYTRIRLTGSLKNWLDFLSLRLEEGVVLYECREVALAIEGILKMYFPTVMKTWREQVYDTVRITEGERQVMKQALALLGIGADVNATLLQDLKNLSEKLK